MQNYRKMNDMSFITDTIYRKTDIKMAIRHISDNIGIADNDISRQFRYIGPSLVLQVHAKHADRGFFCDFILNDV